MADAFREHAWDHTSLLRHDIINAHSKHHVPLQRIHPMMTGGTLITDDNIDRIAGLFCGEE